MGFLSIFPGRYRVQPIVHSATENSAGNSRATGTGCGWHVWLALLLCSPCHRDTVHSAGCIVSLSCCHLTVLLCCSHRAFFLPDMSYLYKTLFPLQSQCRWRQAEKLPGHILCAKEGSGIHAGPDPFFISLA